MSTEEVCQCGRDNEPDNRWCIHCGRPRQLPTARDAALNQQIFLEHVGTGQWTLITFLGFGNWKVVFYPKRDGQKQYPIAHMWSLKPDGHVNHNLPGVAVFMDWPPRDQKHLGDRHLMESQLVFNGYAELKEALGRMRAAWAQLCQVVSPTEIYAEVHFGERPLGTPETHP